MTIWHASGIRTRIDENGKPVQEYCEMDVDDTNQNKWKLFKGKKERDTVVFGPHDLFRLKWFAPKYQKEQYGPGNGE